MDKNEAIRIAQRYVEVISKHFSVEEAILFGSFAKGTHHADSDIDIAIVFKNVDDIIDRQIQLLHMRSDDDLIIEPHPFLLNDFNRSNPVVSEILSNGISLMNYAA